ncbi:MAG: beta-ketoacyl-ACP synthase III [Bacilli bacterium]
MFNVRINSVGHYAPSNIVSNSDLEKIVDTDDNWIYTRTGIKNRRISLGENTTDLAYNAAKELDLEGVDLVIFASFTPDKLAPHSAAILKKKLGIDAGTCFDLNAGCSGFIYGLKVAISMLQTGLHKKALVVGSEVISKVLDWNDRGTCVLFGDGAGAMVLESSAKPSFYSIYTNSIDDTDNSLHVGGVENSNFIVKGDESNQVVKMDGTKVFKFATGAVADGIEKALEQSGLTLDDISYIVPHQANERIIKNVSKGKNIPLNKFYLNIDSYGNTSSASIPIAFSEAVEKGVIKRGDKVLFVGFGAGLTWGSTIFEF